MLFDGDLSEPLWRGFGLHRLHKTQEDVIRHIMAGGSATLLAPAGYGKSLTYQLTAMLLPGITVVVSPLKSLMRDQVDALRALGIRAAMLNRDLDADEKRAVRTGIADGDIDLLYLTPEWLLSDPTILDRLEEAGFSLLVVDEAHCISDWGHSFRTAYRELHRVRDRFPDTPVLALTSTATPETLEDIREQLRITDDNSLLFRESLAREDLRYEIEERPKDPAQAMRKLVVELEEDAGSAAIVYCRKREDCVRLARELHYLGIRARAYHGVKSTEERDEILRRFLLGDVQVVVATVAFGMGINKPDVRLVVHWDMPGSIEDFYQKSGRAGRDGKPARALLMRSRSCLSILKHFASRHTEPWRRNRAFSRLAAVRRLATTRSCREAVILRYLGESGLRRCGTCDNCTSGRALAW